MNAENFNLTPTSLAMDATNSSHIDMGHSSLMESSMQNNPRYGPPVRQMISQETDNNLIQQVNLSFPDQFYEIYQSIYSQAHILHLLLI